MMRTGMVPSQTARRRLSFDMLLVNEGEILNLSSSVYPSSNVGVSVMLTRDVPVINELTGMRCICA